MSNGKDKPGEYRFLPKPSGTQAQKDLADAQEVERFLLVAMDNDSMVFYRKDKH
jgi:hypothetical protein